jgi:hypothetical protein
MSRGRIPASSDCSATRAARLAERTEAKVALASTNVPPPVVNAEIITQSVTFTSYGPFSRQLAKPRRFGLHDVSPRRSVSATRLEGEVEHRHHHEGSAGHGKVWRVLRGRQGEGRRDQREGRERGLREPRVHPRRRCDRRGRSLGVTSGLREVPRRPEIGETMAGAGHRGRPRSRTSRSLTSTRGDVALTRLQKPNKSGVPSMRTRHSWQGHFWVVMRMAVPGWREEYQGPTARCCAPRSRRRGPARR